jgi:hypothetical protein
MIKQIFALTNDLNDKDDLIVKLKREVAALERTVFIKEKEHEQDSIVKVQLGKRLEQVLLDKEEAYEELEQLQVLYCLIMRCILFTENDMLCYDVVSYNFIS